MKCSADDDWFIVSAGAGHGMESSAPGGFGGYIFARWTQVKGDWRCCTNYIVLGVATLDGDAGVIGRFVDNDERFIVEIFITFLSSFLICTWYFWAFSFCEYIFFLYLLLCRQATAAASWFSTL